MRNLVCGIVVYSGQNILYIVRRPAPYTRLPSGVCPKVGVVCSVNAMTSIPETASSFSDNNRTLIYFIGRGGASTQGSKCAVCGCKDGTRAADPRPGTTQVLAPSTISAKSQWVGAVPIGSSVVPAGVCWRCSMQSSFDFEKLAGEGKERRKKKKGNRKACTQLML